MTQRLVCSGLLCSALPLEERATLEIPGHAPYWDCVLCWEARRRPAPEILYPRAEPWEADTMRQEVQHAEQDSQRVGQGPDDQCQDTDGAHQGRQGRSGTETDLSPGTGCARLH